MKLASNGLPVSRSPLSNCYQEQQTKLVHTERRYARVYIAFIKKLSSNQNSARKLAQIACMQAAPVLCMWHEATNGSNTLIWIILDHSSDGKNEARNHEFGVPRWPPQDFRLIETMATYVDKTRKVHWTWSTKMAPVVSTFYWQNTFYAWCSIIQISGQKQIPEHTWICGWRTEC